MDIRLNKRIYIDCDREKVEISSILEGYNKDKDENNLVSLVVQIGIFRGYEFLDFIDAHTTGMFSPSSTEWQFGIDTAQRLLEAIDLADAVSDNLQKQLAELKETIEEELENGVSLFEVMLWS